MYSRQVGPSSEAPAKKFIVDSGFLAYKDAL
jgi:hypothetical protein